MAKRLEGRIALVTGGDQGIGHGIALRLAQEGADVAIGFRSNKDGAAETTRQLQSLGIKSVAVQGDLGKIDDVRRIVSEAI